MGLFRLVIILSLILSMIVQANAANELAQANNLLANMQAFNMQNYYYPQISGFDQKGDTLWAPLCTTSR